ncbi:MAG: isoleucine--tRNA ligase [Coriobacteriia bacterium]|nr:isoleucine--tRNA ligase [Coriobacteriia bacterium]
MAQSYKETMNLPKTDFPMRGNLPQNEPKRLEQWEQQQLYWKVLEKNATGEPFVLHDGPPYANGPIHIGHAFNKILKDFVVKCHAQRGYYTPYIPGWDCHGQPIEHMVETTLGKEKMAQTSQPELRKLCHDWASKYVGVQREGFKRLGVNGDWEHPYLTYHHSFETADVELFKDMYLNGSVYRGRKPIHWCSNCHTALAEAEIEYGDESSPSIYVNFFFEAMPEAVAGAAAAAGLGEAPCAVVIWTTTPWTLPANQAVSLAPDADYVVAVVDGNLLVMAEDLAGAVAEVAGWEDIQFLQDGGGRLTFKGTALEGATYVHPVCDGETGVIITGTHVTLDTGTGAVHTAPGHGVDDYKVCQAKGIKEIKMPVDDEGRFYQGTCRWEGLSTWEANEPIIEYLRQAGTLVARVDINHSYPHCWRCHKPVIFRATTQWFVSMDETGLRQKAVDAIQNDVQWIPDWSKNRIGAMVSERPDWCISRQRSWGVPIPVFKCATCGETVATEATFDAVIDLFDREGSDAWFIRKPAEYLPEGTCCPACGGTELLPEKDILDVWWESGVSHAGVLLHRAEEGLRWPADLYLEGSDQHRGWFQSSLLTSVGAFGKPPYKAVMHCGFTVDENGEKMSKSKGNGIDPAEVIGKFGADVLRLWVSSVDFSQDVRISDGILKQVSDAYRKFRNTFRFLLGSLDDFAYKNAVEWDVLEPIDRYMMVRTVALLQDVTSAYEEYRFNGVYRALYDFVNDTSAIYMDVAKDRLYSEAADSPRRRAVQTVLMNILEVMVRAFAPILSFTADEVWEYFPAGMRELGRPFCVMLGGGPGVDDLAPGLRVGAVAEAAAEAFAQMMAVRDVVTKALEDARGAKVINKSQEAAVVVTAPADVVAAAQAYDPAVFQELFIVASVAFVEGAELAAEISVAEGDKCPRCWNIRQLGADPSHADVCERCAGVLAGQGL